MYDYECKQDYSLNNKMDSRINGPSITVGVTKSVQEIHLYYSERK